MVLITNPLTYRMPYRIQRTIGWLNRSAILDTGPADVLIEVTSCCDLSCPNCRRSEFVTTPEHMTMDVFRTALAHAAPGLDMAFLFGWGEPFLWPHLVEAIALSRDMGVPTNITTSAAFPCTEDVYSVLKAGPDMLVIALDSHLPEVYEKYRAGAAFEDTVSTARRMIECAATPDSPTTVVMQMIRWPEMRGQEREYIRFAKSLGPVDVAIRRSFEGSNGHPEDSPETRRRPCPVLWHGPAYIRTDGTVFPCCLLQTTPLGNIREASLAALWNGEAMQRLRRNHRRRDFSDLPECRRCYHTASNGYPRIYVLAGCMFGGPAAKRWMYRLDRRVRFNPIRFWK